MIYGPLHRMAYGPEVFNFSVRPGAKRIVVSCSLPSIGSVIAQLISPSKTYTETDMAVYENTTINVAAATTYQYVKRVTLDMPPPTKAENWTLQLTLSMPMAHQISIEIS